MIKLLFLGNFGGGEIIIIALVILLLFGGKKIPELMKGLGKGVKSFKDGMNEVEKQIDDAPTDAADKSSAANANAAGNTNGQNQAEADSKPTK